MSRTHQEIFERYVHAGPISRDPDAVAALFTPDGVFEAPLLPAGHALPRRLSGREEIRTGIGAFHHHPAFQGAVDLARSRYVLHETADPDVFIVETDTAFVAAGEISLVQIFRIRDGEIALMRDYFAA
ncbi:nuclear transport factor 2 family protein [Actinoplanes sp. NPDC049548]|uniref:nuclear transport factor 2 family protein n=1 Tax=Actinoplanes sp. NPDC049548 TaxID=3155152 RepID=UPI0034355990